MSCRPTPDDCRDIAAEYHSPNNPMPDPRPTPEERNALLTTLATALRSGPPARAAQLVALIDHAMGCDDIALDLLVNCAEALHGRKTRYRRATEATIQLAVTDSQTAQEKRLAEIRARLRVGQEALEARLASWTTD